MNRAWSVYGDCPSCGQPGLGRCRCLLGDTRCLNGHHWHHCPGCGAVVLGESDHAKPTEYDLCDQCKAKETK